MSFELGFLEEALKEWRKIDKQIQVQFKKKLAERLLCPRVPSSNCLVRKIDTKLNSET